MNEKIEQYESLLNEMASLEKECIHLSIAYVKEFGEEINNIFALKIECIELKKKIAFCIKAKNNNQPIDLAKMKAAIDKAMSSYKKELKDKIAFKNWADSNDNKQVAYEDGRIIKQMYYKIVHLIHPDLHPELITNKKINDLWIVSVDAYKRNDLKTLKRTYDQILLIVGDNLEIVLDNIDLKISVIDEDIKEIKDNNPYKYKFILNDEDEIISVHNKNIETEQYYKNYKKTLTDEFSKLINQLTRLEA